MTGDRHRYRFLVPDRGAGIDVRAESPSLAWVVLRTQYAGPVREGPIRIDEPAVAMPRGEDR